MADQPASNLSDLVTDFTQDYRLKGGGVPSSRKIISGSSWITINGTTQHDLTADITIAETISGGGAGPVGVGRQVISGTTALTVNGGSSHDLTADITLAIASFAGTTPGLVPIGTGDATQFLSQGGWTAGTIVGVSSVAAGAGIAVSAATGAVTISGVLANLTTIGMVPAIGSADSSYFLARTNPPTWVQPGLTGFISLQGSYPGGQQTGNGNISGTFSAGKLMAGTNIGLGVISGAGDGTIPTLALAKYAASAQGAKVRFASARGTEGSPSVLNDADGMAVMTLYAKIAAGWTEQPWITAYADGAVGGGSFQPFYADQFAGGLSTFSQMRLSTAGLLLRPNSGSLFGSTDRANHGLDLGGSLGLKIETKTATFTPADTSCFYLCDGTAGAMNAALPSAVGRTGRIYGFQKVDETVFHVVSVIPTGGQLIDGLPGYQLYAKSEGLFVISDGSNWWSFARSVKTEQTCQLNDTTLANSTTETVIGTTTNWNLAEVGGVQWSRFAGKFSTVSTPTLRMRLYDNAGPTLMADSTAITMPNVTNAAWQVAFRAYARSISGSNPNSRVIEAFFRFASSSGQVTTYSMFSSFADLTATGKGGHQLSAQWGTMSASDTITCTAAQGGSTDHAPVF